MRLFIPRKYRRHNGRRGKPEQAALRAYEQLKRGDWSRVRRLDVLPHARVINVMPRYRLFSLNEGRTWRLLKHPEYERQIQHGRHKNRSRLQNPETEQALHRPVNERRKVRYTP
ncbi:hypothetical protein [Salmonella enterica]|uniref:ParE family toxin-like protein n=1 Tax=Salmonella enterica TaxID=28901 RepID=UPI003D2FBBF1